LFRFVQNRCEQKDDTTTIKTNRSVPETLYFGLMTMFKIQGQPPTIGREGLQRVEMETKSIIMNALSDMRYLHILASPARRERQDFCPEMMMMMVDRE
jgi:hypothetical protein